MLHGQSRHHARKNAWKTYLVVLAVLVLAAVTYTAYQFQAGLTRPSVGVKALVASVNDVESILDAKGSLRDYGDAVRVSYIAYQRFDPKNGGDSGVRRLVGRAIDYHLAAREAWAADEDGLWASETFGDPALWHTTHPELDLGDLGPGPLDPHDVTAMCWDRAADLLDEARGTVGE